MEKATNTRELTMKGSRKAAPTPNKTEVIRVRCTPVDKAQIAINAAPYGSMSDYLRKLGLGHVLKLKPTDEVKELTHQLSRLAVNHNQQTKALNTIAKVIKEEGTKNPQLLKLLELQQPSGLEDQINDTLRALAQHFI